MNTSEWNGTEPPASCDVLVAGSGIAGAVAAIEAASTGASVVLVSEGRCFSGSSFYPGTWGLGLIGPDGEEDAADLAETIRRIGCGVADSRMVEVLVEGILPGMAWLESLGVELMRPANEESAHEAAFIPCFDTHVRRWRGLRREQLVAALGSAFERLGIRVVEGCRLLDVLETAGTARRITGALIAMPGRCGPTSIREIRCRAVVLVGGGTSGLFARRLTSGDVLGSMQGIALAHGCSLVNMEFMQMMPGLVSPKAGLVFNEKTFRYVDPAAFVSVMEGEHSFDAVSGCAAADLSALLEERSGHGPFTSRLADRAIDLAIDCAGQDGLEIRYRFPEHDVPEFVQTFSTWLEDEHGIRADDPMRIALYAHASNGGIKIDADGATGLPGLFACGEVTGGMHGADRLGGLSSANGIVFGRRAGAAAAAWALGSMDAPRDGKGALESVLAAGMCVDGVLPLDTRQTVGLLAQLRSIMSAYAMVNRTEEGLHRALKELDGIERCVAPAHTCATAGDADGVRVLSLSFAAQVLTACAMLMAMRERRESRGAHFRSDVPYEDPAYAAPQEIRRIGTQLVSRFGML